MPEASRLTVAAAALSAVSSPVGLRPCPAPVRLGSLVAGAGVAASGVCAPGLPFLPAFVFGSAETLAMIGRDISIDFSGVTRMSRASWPYLASAAARACAQLSPLLRQEQVGSKDCWNLSAFGMSTYRSPVTDTACSIVPPNGKE